MTFSGEDLRGNKADLASGGMLKHPTSSLSDQSSNRGQSSGEFESACGRTRSNDSRGKSDDISD